MGRQVLLSNKGEEKSGWVRAPLHTQLQRPCSIDNKALLASSKCTMLFAKVTQTSLILTPPARTHTGATLLWV